MSQSSARYQAILLFGAPGSGKGTQGKILSAIPGFFHTSTGDLFRSLDLQSEIGRIFWDYSSRGELVPDEFTINLWKNYIKGVELTNQFHPETQLVVMDGVPRNVGQARLLQESIDVVKIIYLVCSDMSKMVERLRRRALKENRLDDANDAVIRRRLEVYERDTRPILELYPPATIARVDATMSMIGVLSDIVSILRPLKERLDRRYEELPAQRGSA